MRARRTATGVLDCRHHAAVGRQACAVSHGLALLIQEVTSWRIASLIGHGSRLASAHRVRCGRPPVRRPVCAGLRQRAQGRGLKSALVADKHRGRRVRCESKTTHWPGKAVQLPQRIWPVECPVPRQRAAPLLAAVACRTGLFREAAWVKVR